MKKDYYNETDLKETKKHYHRALVFFFISLALLILFPTLVFVLQTRETKFLFILFGSVLTVISLFFVFFLGFIFVKPYHQYLKFVKGFENRGKQLVTASLEDISNEISYRNGCDFRAMTFDMKGKKLLLYVRDEFIKDFEVGKSYSLLVSQLFILEMEEAQG